MFCQRTKKNVSLPLVSCSFIIILLLLSFISDTQQTSIVGRTPKSTAGDTPVEIWSLQAFSMIDALSCRQLYIFDNDLCDRIKLSRHRTQMNLYLSNNGRIGNYTVIYPDNSLQHDPHHNLVVGIDPFPQHATPHVLFLFFLDRISHSQCERKSGKYYNKFCLYLAQKKQCVQDLNSHCQLRYLPLVVDSDAVAEEQSQNFKCHEDILVTATCPQQTELNKKEPLCISDPSNPTCAKSLVTNLCQKDIICDYGFIISGGWNEINARKWSEDNAIAMYNQFTKQGFHKDSLRILINNATSYKRENKQEPEIVWGASEKSQMRSSIRKVCNCAFCADTVVIYWSGVTAQDGSLLLWDVNNDGIVDSSERYSPFHLLKDTSNCKANRVILIVDSTNTETLITKLSQLKLKGTHENMIVIGAGRFGQLPDDTFVKVFTQFSGMQFCLAEALLDIERQSEIDPFLMLPQGGGANVNVTLSGATCSEHSNLPTKTSGCNQLPSMMWKLFT